MDARLGFTIDKELAPGERDSHPGERLIEAEEWPAIATLFDFTHRQWEVVVLLFQGQTREAIAHQLDIKTRTVCQYVEQIHCKLDVTDRVELVLLIVECRDQLRAMEGIRIAETFQSSTESPTKKPETLIGAHQHESKI